MRTERLKTIAFYKKSKLTVTLFCMKPVRTLNCFTKYKCLQDKCKQSCCCSWTIDVDEETLKKWKERAPHLLEYVIKRVSGDGHKMITKDDNCIALKNHMCTIQSEYGVDMIPDLCGYFPHQYKDFGKYIYSSINCSCPAVLKTTLFCNKKDDWKFVDWKPNYNKSKIYSYKEDITISYNECEKLMQNIFSLLDDEKENFDILLATFVKLCFENHELSTKDFAASLKSDFAKYKKQIKAEYVKRKSEVSDVFFTAVSTLLDIEEKRDLITKIKKKLKLDYLDGRKVELGTIGLVVNGYNNIINNYKKNTKKQIDLIIKNYFKTRLAEFLFPAYFVLNGLRSTLTYIICELMLVKLALMVEIETKKDLKDKDKIIHTAAIIGRIFYARTRASVFEKIKNNYWFDRETLNNFILYY